MKSVTISFKTFKDYFLKSVVKLILNIWKQRRQFSNSPLIMVVCLKITPKTLLLCVTIRKLMSEKLGLNKRNAQKYVFSTLDKEYGRSWSEAVWWVPS